MALASRREVVLLSLLCLVGGETVCCGRRVAGEQPCLLCVEGKASVRWLQRQLVGLDHAIVSSCHCCRHCCSSCGKSCIDREEIPSLGVERKGKDM